MIRAFSPYLIFAVILIVFVSCAVNPVTGKRELMLLSEADEISLGQETDPQIVQMYGIYDNPDLTTYIAAMGQKMGKLSHRPQLNYQFKIMDSPVINAFAVPGGYVYFTRGIMAYLNNEAELAGVMGHEIGHITARHSAKQYSKAQLAQLGLGVGSILSETFAQYAGVAAQGVGILFLKFSRDNEREADDLGVEYSSKAGYDAREMANFFATLDKMHGGGGSLPDFLSTHPNPDDRIGSVQRAAQKWQTQLKLTNATVNHDGYLKLIDGIVFGDDPRQGFVENNMFYHPVLKFQFPVPSGWNLSNLPSQVQIVSSDENAVILFTLGTQSSPAAEAGKFASESGATVLSQQETTINRLKTVRMESQLVSEQGTLRILSHFVSKDGSVFVFHGFTAEASFGSYEATFRNTLNGFGALTDRTKLNVKPDRIKVIKTTQNMSLNQVFRNFGVPDAELQKMALLNGRELTDQIPSETSLKIVEKGR